MPLMPVKQNTGTSFFDGPPLVSCAALCVHDGKFTEALDCFAHPFWDEVRNRVAGKSLEMRRQGFFGAAMLPMSELEYTGIVETLSALEGRFRVRAEAPARQAA
jgi:fructose 1,6-bisphosphate aldolase/phosphatase